MLVILVVILVACIVLILAGIIKWIDNLDSW